MKAILETERVPIKMWLNDLESNALTQAQNLANLPFAYSHIAIMPDAHSGYGMPIGGILATKNEIIPNAVGVDIGCGMIAVKSNLSVSGLEKKVLQKIVHQIHRSIPVGFNKHKVARDASLMPQGHNIDEMTIVKEEFSNALKQLGTLGGGNHFIELQKDTDDFLWLMIHSGSRNIGQRVANHYNKLAENLHLRQDQFVDPKIELCYLPMNSAEGNSYYNEMRFCYEFGMKNREEMANKIMEIIGSEIINTEFQKPINLSHNYANWETHFNERVLVHRKGSTPAMKGQLGIIPGSQGTKSYIVEGLGNPESFMSCSHGAGRKFGRSSAQKTLNLEVEQAIMNNQGILHNLNSIKRLDEAPGAYKDIEVVMKNQSDLVKPIVELSPIAVIKG